MYEQKQSKSKKSHKAVYIISFIIALLAGSTGATLVYCFLPNFNTHTETSVIMAEGEIIAEAVEKIGPSVVSIVIENTSVSNSPWAYGQSYSTQSAGSGIIVSEDGYILTNKHVVSDGATKVKIILADGTEYDNVEIVDRDPTNDIAFLKIKDVSNLPAAEIGASVGLRIGTKVLAIGNALGQLQNTVTSGIISGLNRSITATDDANSFSENLTDLIQTDAAINPGNSGGPLITYDGKVIGVNTAVADSANGIGFAIPSDILRGAVTSITKNGRIEKPYLGVYYTTLTKAIAKEKNLIVDQGALVGGGNQRPTVSGSPADKAGIKSGDIIIKIDDRKLDEQYSLSYIIAGLGVGDHVTLTILRDGQEMSMEITLEEYKR